MKAETLEHAGDGATGVVSGGFEDAVLQGGLLELAFGFYADLAFEIGVRGRKQAGVAGIDFGSGVVDAGAEDLRGGQVDGDVGGVDLNVAGLQVREIDASNDFAVYYEKQAVTGQEFGEVGVGVLSGNDFVHGVADGFETLEFLNLADDGGLIDVDLGVAAVAQSAEQME